MSANNKLIIYKKDKKYIVGHLDVDCGWHDKEMFVEDNLEKAVKKAEKFMSEEIVEYGLDINI